jgi:hypothetical protein
MPASLDRGQGVLLVNRAKAKAFATGSGLAWHTQIILWPSGQLILNFDQAEISKLPLFATRWPTVGSATKS